MLPTGHAIAIINLNNHIALSDMKSFRAILTLGAVITNFLARINRLTEIPAAENLFRKSSSASSSLLKSPFWCRVQKERKRIHGQK